MQPKYEKFIQAVLLNDTIKAEEILKSNIKIQPILEKAFPIKNIPAHIFKINVTALKDTIVNLFKIENDTDKNKFLRDIFYFFSENHRMQVFFVAETNKDTIFSREYFSGQPKSDDVFLTPFAGTWLSKFYYSDDHPLKYTTEFALKLKMVDSSSTELKVVALNPQVVNGMSIEVHGPQNEYAKVQPTTIEEYSILLFIADKLGDKTLLPLRLPKK